MFSNIWFDRRPGLAALAMIVGFAGARQLEANPREEFAALEAEMDAAAETHADAVRAARIARATGTDKSEQPPVTDPRVPVLRRMDAFIAAHAGADIAGFAAGQAFLWSVGIEPGNAQKRFERLAAEYPDDETTTDALEQIPDVFAESGSPDDWIKTLAGLAQRTSRPETRRAAHFMLGQVALRAGQLDKARAAFETVVKMGPMRPAPAPESVPPDTAHEHADHDHIEERLPETDFFEEARAALHEITRLQVGMVAPDFSATTLDGRTVTLQSLRGKIVLLNFWATWCPPCVSEIPHLRHAIERFKDRPFEIIAISADDNREALDNVVRTLNVPGIHVFDAKGVENEVNRLYNVQNFPTWYLIDQSGVIRKRQLTSADLIAEVQSLLDAGGTPKSTPSP